MTPLGSFQLTLAVSILLCWQIKNTFPISFRNPNLVDVAGVSGEIIGDCAVDDLFYHFYPSKDNMFPY